MEQSIRDATKDDALFYPWQLDSVLTGKLQNVVLFDIRNNFVFGQGHIPGAQNMSANDLTKKANIKKLEKLDEKGITVVLYGDNELEAIGPRMLFRQTGFENIKVLAGGYNYYILNNDSLMASKGDDSYKKGIARYDYAKMAAPNDGFIQESTAEKVKITVRRREKSSVIAGGC